MLPPGPLRGLPLKSLWNDPDPPSVTSQSCAAGCALTANGNSKAAAKLKTFTFNIYLYSSVSGSKTAGIAVLSPLTVKPSIEDSKMSLQKSTYFQVRFSL